MKSLFSGSSQFLGPSSSSSINSSSSESSSYDYSISSYFLPKNHCFPVSLISTYFFASTGLALCFKSNSFFQAIKLQTVTGVNAENLGLSKTSSTFLTTCSSSMQAFPSTRYSTIQILTSSMISQMMGLSLFSQMMSSILLVISFKLSLVMPVIGSIQYLMGVLGQVLVYSKCRLSWYQNWCLGRQGLMSTQNLQGVCSLTIWNSSKQMYDKMSNSSC